MYFIKSIIRISETHVNDVGNKSLQTKFMNVTNVLESADHAEKPISLREATIINIISEDKDIADIIVEQNARHKNVLANRHQEFAILNVTDVFPCKNKNE